MTAITGRKSRRQKVLVDRLTLFFGKGTQNTPFVCVCVGPGEGGMGAKR